MTKKRKPDGYYEQKFDFLKDEGLLMRPKRLSDLHAEAAVADAALLLDTDHEDECPLCKCGTVEHDENEVRCKGECGAVEQKPLDKSFRNSNCCVISYEDVIKACDGEPFKMKLVGEEGQEVMRAVNIGIDSHLEACFIKGQDEFGWDEDGKLDCKISPESLPILIRRLFDKDDLSSIAESILTALGFNEEGNAG